MIPEAVFREFPTETCRKRPISDRKMSGIRRTILSGSCRFRAESDTSCHRIRSLVYCFYEISGIVRAGLFELGKDNFDHIVYVQLTSYYQRHKRRMTVIM